MNIGEASDVQKLLTYLLDDDRACECKDVRAAVEAAQRLLDRSHKALGTGMTGADVPDLSNPCDGCDECMRPIVDVPVGELL